MSTHSFLLTALAIIPLSSIAFATPLSSPGACPSVAIVQEIPGARNLENLALRHNGEILVTSTTSSSLYQISTAPLYAAISVADITGVSGLLGIVELERDVFYVAGSNISNFVGTPRSSNVVWRVDMRTFSSRNGTVVQKPKISHVATLSTAGLLNGMCRLSPKDNSHVLIADSTNGNIIKLNVDTGDHEIIIKDPTLTITTSQRIPVAVNGIHTYGEHLFFTNLNQGLFAKVPISLSTGGTTGPVEIILNNTLVNADDFALSRDGKKAWIAENGEYVLIEADITRKTSRVLVNSTLLGATSSIALGQSKFDQDTLYVTGDAPANGITVGSLTKVSLGCS